VAVQTRHAAGRRARARFLSARTPSAEKGLSLNTDGLGGRGELAQEAKEKAE